MIVRIIAAFGLLGLVGMPAEATAQSLSKKETKKLKKEVSALGKEMCECMGEAVELMNKLDAAPESERAALGDKLVKVQAKTTECMPRIEQKSKDIESRYKFQERRAEIEPILKPTLLAAMRKSGCNEMATLLEKSEN